MRVCLSLVLLLAMASYSSGTYCLCKDGVGEKQLQTALDYACGAGADCTPILKNGVCFQPDTVKSHCDWAVNSYFQRSTQVPGSCNFSDSATLSSNPPSTTVTGCIYPSSPGNAGTTNTSSNGGGGSTGTNVFPGPPAFGPAGIIDPGNSASSLFISSTIRFGFSFLAFLWSQ